MIFVKSQRARERVMERITNFIEKKLRLKVKKTDEDLWAIENTRIYAHSYSRTRYVYTK